MFGLGKGAIVDESVVRCGKCGAAASSRRPMVHEYDAMVVGAPAQVRCLRCFGAAAADQGTPTPVRFG